MSTTSSCQPHQHRLGNAWIHAWKDSLKKPRAGSTFGWWSREKVHETVARARYHMFAHYHKVVGHIKSRKQEVRGALLEDEVGISQNHLFKFIYLDSWVSILSSQFIHFGFIHFNSFISIIKFMSIHSCQFFPFHSIISVLSCQIFQFKSFM